jgi:predicted membrane protein DUF2254
MEGGAFVRSGAVGRSSDVNLWRIPLGFSLASLILFGLTMIPDVLDARGVIHLPEWFTIGGIDDARAILSAMLSCVSTVLALIFSVSLLVLSMVATLFGPRPPLSIPRGLGHTGHHRPLHGHFHLPVSGLSGDPSGPALDLYP